MFDFLVGYSAIGFRLLFDPLPWNFGQVTPTNIWETSTNMFYFK